MAEYLFVYGTLLKGEPGNTLINNCILEDYLSIPGTLYNTGLGFPAASLIFNKDSRIFGELYRLPNENKLLLKELDDYENTSEGLFNRDSIKIKNNDCFIYSLKDPGFFNEERSILSGSWLEFSHNIKEDPVSFAVNFEQKQVFHYRYLTSDKTIVLPGNSGIIVSAPHATNHIRLNKYKVHERYTGALSALMHSLTGATSIYSNSVSISDSNYYDNSAYKTLLEKTTGKYRYNFLLDIHGTGEEREFDLYPGIGINKKFLLGRTKILDDLYRTADKYKISLGGLDRFPASKQQTVTKFCATQLGIPSMQIEINKRYRKPESGPEKFLDMILFLRDFLELVKKRNEQI